MTIHEENRRIASTLLRAAKLLELVDENPYRACAYENAAGTVQSLQRPISELANKPHELRRLPGIGATLAAHIHTILENGSFPVLDELEKDFPDSVLELFKLPGLGATSILHLKEVLGITCLEDLERACRRGEVAEVRGFGLRTQERLLNQINRMKASHRRVLRSDAEPVIKSLTEHLAGVEGIWEAHPVGAYRRHRMMIRMANFLILADSNAPRHLLALAAANRFTTEGVSVGERDAVSRLRIGIPLQLNLLPTDCRGSGLIYFTGPRAFFNKLRQIAGSRGMILNEFGLFLDGDRLGGEDEQDIFERLGIAYIAPEDRYAGTLDQLLPSAS